MRRISVVLGLACIVALVSVLATRGFEAASIALVACVVAWTSGVLWNYDTAVDKQGYPRSKEDGAVFTPSENGSDCAATVSTPKLNLEVGQVPNADAQKPQIAVAAPTTLEKSDIHLSPREYCLSAAADFGLTPRESDVFLLLVKGDSSSHIAKELFVSIDTVKSHTKHIYKKMGVHSRQELIEMIVGL